MHNHSKPRYGFTLVELLVVVAIIGVLISIIVPSVAGAKGQAKKMACAANMSQLVKALHVYFGESDGRFPPNGTIIPKGSGLDPLLSVNDQDKWRLDNGALFHILNGQRKIYLCPEDDRQRLSANALVLDNANQVQVGGSKGDGFWSYSVNAVTNSQGKFRLNFPSKPWPDPLNMSRVTDQTSFVVFIEEDARSSFNDEVFDPPAFNGGDKLTNRHGGFGNVAFLGGNVESVRDVLFNNVPSIGGGGDMQAAMQSPYTRWFFPDGGAFAFK